MQHTPGNKRLPGTRRKGAENIPRAQVAQPEPLNLPFRIKKQRQRQLTLRSLIRGRSRNSSAPRVPVHSRKSQSVRARAQCRETQKGQRRRQKKRRSYQYFAGFIKRPGRLQRTSSIFTARRGTQRAFLHGERRKKHVEVCAMCII